MEPIIASATKVAAAICHVAVEFMFLQDGPQHTRHSTFLLTFIFHSASLIEAVLRYNRATYVYSSQGQTI